MHVEGHQSRESPEYREAEITQASQHPDLSKNPLNKMESEESLNEPEKIYSKTSSPSNSRIFDGDIEKVITQPDLEAGNATAAKKVVTAQDWTGPDDPENPFNWSMTKRVYHVTIVGLMGFTV